MRGKNREFAARKGKGKLRSWFPLNKKLVSQFFIFLCHRRLSRFLFLRAQTFLEVSNPFSHSFSQLGEFAGSEEQYGYTKYQ